MRHFMKVLQIIIKLIFSINNWKKDKLMTIQHICFIVPKYPTKSDPVYTFVRQLVASIADLGYQCSVIAPQSITSNLVNKLKKRPVLWQDITQNGSTIDVYQPEVLSFSNLKFRGADVSERLLQNAVIHAFNKIPNRPDVLYGHFWHSGVTAGIISKKFDIPFFVATGESNIWVKKLYNQQTIDFALENVSGVICVSSKNKYESIALNLASENKMIVLPNAVDANQFYKISQDEARKKLGFEQENFIVAYTGEFSHRKGIQRLSDALKKLDNIKAIYIGDGDLKQHGDEILFQGKLPHNELVNYLNCADVFVLPTLAEGCCNAIVEAMACGLPIISSELSFNDDLLTDSNAIRINSMDIDAIANAIQSLYEDRDRCKAMGIQSQKQAKLFEINTRAVNVMSFINQKIKEEIGQKDAENMDKFDVDFTPDINSSDIGA